MPVAKHHARLYNRRHDLENSNLHDIHTDLNQHIHDKQNLGQSDPPICCLACKSMHSHRLTQTNNAFRAMPNIIESMDYT